MKNNNKYIIAIIMLLVVTISNAQQNAVFTHYTINPYLYNAAQVGETGYSTLGVHYRKQWVDMPDAPDTKLFSAQTMIKNKFGLGAKIYYDQVHVIKNFGALFSYAYYLRFNKESMNKHYLSFGLSAGFKSQTLNFDDVTLKDEFDPEVFFEGATNTVFDAELGVKYKFKGLHIGIFASNITPQSFKYTSSINALEFTPSYHLYGSLGLDIKLDKSDNFTLKPSILVRHVPNIPFQVDGNLILDWKNSIWFGGGYRYNNVGAWALAGFRIHDMISLTYSYEQSLDSYQTPFGASHEISLDIRFTGKNKLSQADLEAKLDKKIRAIRNRLLTKYNGIIDSLDQLNAKVDSLSKKSNEVIEQNIIENASTVVHKGTKVKYTTIGTVSFLLNSATIHKEQEVEALDVYEKIKAVEDKIILIRIEGNASIEGSETYNLILSNKRTIAMKDYLVSKGINQDLIATSSKGNSSALLRDDNYKDKQVIKPNPHDRYVKIYIMFNE